MKYRRNYYPTKPVLLPSPGQHDIIIFFPPRPPLNTSAALEVFQWTAKYTSGYTFLWIPIYAYQAYRSTLYSPSRSKNIFPNIRVAHTRNETIRQTAADGDKYKNHRAIRTRTCQHIDNNTPWTLRLLNLSVWKIISNQVPILFVWSYLVKFQSQRKSPITTSLLDSPLTICQQYHKPEKTDQIFISPLKIEATKKKNIHNSNTNWQIDYISKISSRLLDNLISNYKSENICILKYYFRTHESTIFHNNVSHRRVAIHV